MKKVLCLLFIANLIGCSGNKQKGLVYYNDLEGIKGWTDILLEKKPVHSGIYSNRLDSVHVYGENFKLSFKEISEHILKKVKISAWVFIPDSTIKGKLVMEINQPDKKNVFWIGKDLKEYVNKFGEWIEIKQEFTFVKKEIMVPQNHVKIFVWNLSKKEMYVDDIRIEFVL
ncbi:MAG TPA: hypothetical protein VNY73_09780 [Bacteroidia bacterium]|nr:hypothetical protein [Bacteroidia bacterium]